jgi:hypothetical protein
MLWNAEWKTGNLFNEGHHVLDLFLYICVAERHFELRNIPEIRDLFVCLFAFEEILWAAEQKCTIGMFSIQ